MNTKFDGSWDVVSRAQRSSRQRADILEAVLSQSPTLRLRIVKFPSSSGGIDAFLNRGEPSNYELFLKHPLRHLAILLNHLHSQHTGYVLPIQSIRVVYLSETHNARPASIPRGDVLVHAGDLTQSGRLVELEETLAWLDALPHAHKFVISGNHDLCLNPSDLSGSSPREDSTIDWSRWPTLTYLQDTSTTISIHGRELLVYGSPWAPKHGNWAFQYPPHPLPLDSSFSSPSSMSAAQSHWSRIPSATSILITHGPPMAHLDLASLGCPALLQTLWNRPVRPLLHVFGHIHAARGIARVDWGAAQKAYEGVMLSGKSTTWAGMKGLVRLIWAVAEGGIRMSVGGQSFPVNGVTTFVNAAIRGGHRDDEIREPLVVEI